MADPRDIDTESRDPANGSDGSNLPHGDIRPTDGLYVDEGENPMRSGQLDHTAPYARPRSNRWGRIALIAAAAILGLALLSAMFTGVSTEDTSLATVETAEPVVTGAVPETTTIIVPTD